MDEVANTTLPANHVHHILLADPKVDWLARLIVVCIYRKRRLRIQHRLFLVKKMLFAPNSSTPLVRLNYISVICCYLVLLSARNIPRPLFFVYRKICREFDVDHYVHKWSTDLEQQLLRLATPEIGEASIRFSPAVGNMNCMAIGGPLLEKLWGSVEVLPGTSIGISQAVSEQVVLY